MGTPGTTGAAPADGDAEGAGDTGAETEADTDGDGDGAGDGDRDGDALDPVDASDDGLGDSSAEHPARPRQSTPTPAIVNANRDNMTSRFSAKPTTFLLQLLISSSRTSKPGLN